MAVNVTYQANVTVVETIANNDDGLSTTAAQKQVTYNAFNTSKTLNASSSPAATTHAAFTAALSGGALTVDLTSLTGTNGATVSMSGLKVQVLRCKAPTSNANPITITPGASNGYDICGADFSVTLSPGQEVTIYGNDATPDVAGTDKTLDLAGTGSQELEMEIVAG